MQIDRKATVANVREKCGTLKHWAKDAGFNYATVCGVLNGQGIELGAEYGIGKSGAIIKTLKKQKLLVTVDPPVAVNG